MKVKLAYSVALSLILAGVLIAVNQIEFKQELNTITHFPEPDFHQQGSNTMNQVNLNIIEDYNEGLEVAQKNRQTYSPVFYRVECCEW